MGSSRFVALALAAAFGLGGCASLRVGGALEPGTQREAVLSSWGTPTRIVRLAAGERLQYSLQPSGRRAWMVDLDSAGRVVRSRQVLTEPDFLRIDLGRWTREDVEREFGPPAWVDRVGNWPGPIMTYRWQDDVNDMFYWVYLDDRNVAQRAHGGVDYPPPQQPDKP